LRMQWSGVSHLMDGNDLGREYLGGGTSGPKRLLLLQDQRQCRITIYYASVQHCGRNWNKYSIAWHPLLGPPWLLDHHRKRPTLSPAVSVVVSNSAVFNHERLLAMFVRLRGFRCGR